MERVIPYGAQSIEEEDIDAVVNVLRSERITQGPRIDEFERAIGDYVGTRYAVAFSSGTAALHAACMAVGLEAGDEVITTPLSFVATANCALYAGATPIFADIDPHSLNLDPEKVRKKITSRSKILIPVDFAGQPCDMERFKDLAVEQRLVVIEDAAHALGSVYKGRRVGAFADMAILSFHPVKHITTGEGGMVVTNDKGLRDKLVSFRSHGIVRNREQLGKSDEGSWYYEMQELGYNYRITDIQCALGLTQLRRLESFIQRRREIAGRYDKAFEPIPGLVLPSKMSDSRSSYHLYVLQLPIDRLKAGRRGVFNALVNRKIGVNVHYIPIHLQPFYQKNFGYSPGDYPVAEYYYDRALTIPLHPKMTDEDVTYVIRSVTEVLQEQSI